MSENQCCHSLCCERCALLRKECPSCHKPTEWNPSPVATKIASTLKAECPFGCGEECSYSDLDRHKSEFCLSALVSCPHPLCSIKIRRRHLEKHLNEECAYKSDNWCDRSPQVHSLLHNHYLIVTQRAVESARSGLACRLLSSRPMELDPYRPCQRQ